ncbi:hypothetical protein LTS18_003862, partial [Coniosporium uncinatum]
MWGLWPTASASQGKSTSSAESIHAAEQEEYAHPQTSSASTAERNTTTASHRPGVDEPLPKPAHVEAQTLPGQELYTIAAKGPSAYRRLVGEGQHNLVLSEQSQP